MKIVLLFSICVLIINSCAVNHKNKVSVNGLKFDKEGHRGCRGLMPENTIPAMLHAIDLEVTTLEMDVHITKDSQIVLSHDPWFNTDITTKPDGNFIAANEPRYILYNMNYADIASFDVGYKPYINFPQQLKIHVAKPLLSVLVDSVEMYLKQKQKTILYNIEIKSSPEGDNIFHPEPGRFTELLVQLITKKQITGRVIIQSFDVRPLKYLHLHYPLIKTSLLIEENNTKAINENLDDLGFTPTIYSPHYSLVTSELAKTCHKNNIRLIPWTVNDLQKMKDLINIGVDGLISDYPNFYKQL